MAMYKIYMPFLYRYVPFFTRLRRRVMCLSIYVYMYVLMCIPLCVRVYNVTYMYEIFTYRSYNHMYICTYMKIEKSDWIYFFLRLPKIKKNTYRLHFYSSTITAIDK